MTNIMLNFFKKHNLKPPITLYLAYCHILSLVGLVYSVIDYTNIVKIISIVIGFHFTYCLGITAGCHRLWAHKSYTASPLLRVFLMLLASGANQGPIFHWSRDHRLHHKFSDTLLDPHSINRGFFFAHVGWLLQQKTQQLITEGRKINMKDLQSDSIVMFQKKVYHLMALLLCWLLPAYTFYHFIEAPILLCICLAAMPYITILHSTWCVNSVAHMFGTRPWNKNINPADNLLVSLISGGQGYHNWHHQYPGDWRGSKDHWYMLNFTARFLELCQAFQLCSLQRIQNDD